MKEIDNVAFENIKLDFRNVVKNIIMNMMAKLIRKKLKNKLKLQIQNQKIRRYSKFKNRNRNKNHFNTINKNGTILINDSYIKISKFKC